MLKIVKYANTYVLNTKAPYKVKTAALRILTRSVLLRVVGVGEGYRADISSNKQIE